MRQTALLANHFLIAVPALLDPNFARGVTLLCQHGSDGAMGLMLSRSSGYTLGELLAQLDLATDDATLAATPVLSGGPVQPERGFVLHEPTAMRWDSSLDISPALCLTTSRDILAAMAAGEGPQRALVALGYAGWSAGQLEEELQDNAWLTVPADAGIVFDTPLAARWEAAAGLMGVDIHRLAHYAGHA